MSILEEELILVADKMENSENPCKILNSEMPTKKKGPKSLSEQGVSVDTKYVSFRLESTI